MKRTIVSVILSCLFFCTMHAQDAAYQTMIKLLSKEWLLQKTDADGHIMLPSNAVPRFRLVMHDNGTCEQGIPPEGMIASHWTLNDNLKEIMFDDPQTKQKFTATIVVVNTTQLILTIKEYDHITTMYYSLQ